MVVYDCSGAPTAPTKERDNEFIGPTLTSSPAGELRTLLASVNLTTASVVGDGNVMETALPTRC
jgi:hypothetical protein